MFGFATYIDMICITIIAQNGEERTEPYRSIILLYVAGIKLV